MSNWKNFEKRIKQESLAQRVLCVKVPDQYIPVKAGKTLKYIPKKTEFDFCFGIDGLAAFADAKSTGRKQFHFKSYLLDEKKIHQWNQLQKSHDEGSVAGLLIWFYELEIVTWASVPVIRYLLSIGSKGLSPESLGVVNQRDSDPINVRMLMAEDIKRSVLRIYHSVKGE